MREITQNISASEKKLLSNSEHVNNIVTSSANEVSKVNATMNAMEGRVLEMSDMVHKIAENAQSNKEMMSYMRQNRRQSTLVRLDKKRKS